MCDALGVDRQRELVTRPHGQEDGDRPLGAGFLEVVQLLLAAIGDHKVQLAIGAHIQVGAPEVVGLQGDVLVGPRGRFLPPGVAQHHLFVEGVVDVTQVPGGLRDGQGEPLGVLAADLGWLAGVAVFVDDGHVQVLAVVGVVPGSDWAAIGQVIHAHRSVVGLLAEGLLLQATAVASAVLKSRGTGLGHALAAGARGVGGAFRTGRAVAAARRVTAHAARGQAGVADTAGGGDELRLRALAAGVAAMGVVLVALHAAGVAACAYRLAVAARLDARGAGVAAAVGAGIAQALAATEVVSAGAGGRLAEAARTRRACDVRTERAGRAGRAAALHAGVRRAHIAAAMKPHVAGEVALGAFAERHRVCRW